MRTHNVSSRARGALRIARSRPIASAITFSVASRSATDAAIRGGDVFEVVARADGSSAVLVADSSSKGLASLAHGETVRRAFRAAALATRSPAAIVSVLDRLRFDVTENTFPAVSATAFVAEIDDADHRLCYASAGHEPALIIDGRAHRHLHATGPLLGIIDRPGRDEVRVAFEPGALLVIATDGFFACRNAALDTMQFGSAGIVRALMFDKRRSPRSAAETIARGADTFTGGRYGDDATVMVIARAM